MSCRPTHLSGGLQRHPHLVAWMVACLLGLLLLPGVLPLAPYAIDLNALLQPPGLHHWLGTDENGRDVLARLLVGGRGTLGVALCATALALLIGTTIGGIAGYRGGMLDALLMRGVDLALAFPSLFAILLVAAILPPGPLLLTGLIGATGWMATARLVRARIQSLLETGYVEAARALGTPGPRIVGRHMVPNLVDVLFVSGLVQLSRAILAEATISFLGFGIQPPVPTWGNLLIGAQHYVFTAPWLTLAPGFALIGTLLGISGLGLSPVASPQGSVAFGSSGEHAISAVGAGASGTNLVRDTAPFSHR